MRRTVVVCEGPAVPSSPWPVRADDLLLRDPVEADVEALLAFRNDPVVNHFMVRTHVDPDDLRRELLAVPGSPPTTPASSSVTARSSRSASSTSSTDPASRVSPTAPTA